MTMTTAPNLLLDWPECLPVWDESIVEGLAGRLVQRCLQDDRYLCRSRVDRGESAEQWYDGLPRNHHTEVDLRVISDVQKCMRSSGLWSWNH
jgi:hypothetical protein